jgi:hypothetical protein
MAAVTVEHKLLLGLFRRIFPETMYVLLLCGMMLIYLMMFVLLFIVLFYPDWPDPINSNYYFISVLSSLFMTFRAADSIHCMSRTNYIVPVFFLTSIYLYYKSLINISNLLVSNHFSYGYQIFSG